MFHNTNFLTLTLVLLKLAATFFKSHRKSIRNTSLCTISLEWYHKFGHDQNALGIVPESFALIVQQKLKIALIFKQAYLQAAVSVKKFEVLLRLKNHLSV